MRWHGRTRHSSLRRELTASGWLRCTGFGKNSKRALSHKLRAVICCALGAFDAVFAEAGGVFGVGWNSGEEFFWNGE